MTQQKTPGLGQTTLQIGGVHVRNSGAKAYENLDAILEVKGFDGYVFGPHDLALSMGLSGQPAHPDVVATERQMADRIHDAGGKLYTELVAVIELRHLIVDAAQQFLADNV